MFKEIGLKIKVLAFVVAVMGIVWAFICMIILMADLEVVAGIVSFLVIAICNIIYSFFIYGFGELVETNAQIRKKLEQDGTDNNLEIIAGANIQQTENDLKKNDTAVIELLHKYKALYDEKIITDEEFEKKKKDLL